MEKKKYLALRNNRLILTAISVLSAVSGAFAQQSYTFTNASATGSIGPNQAAVTSAYNLTSLANAVTVNTAGIQSWTVPTSGGYRIEAWGAQGGTGAGNIGGLGARMAGDFTLTAGTVLKILVGQQGVNRAGSTSNDAGSGGGGSFIATSANAPLVVAGGGGGGGQSQAGLAGTVSVNGSNSATGSSGIGGTNGGGGGAALSGTAGTQTSPGGNGSSCSYGAGGGGFYTNGGLNCSGGLPQIAGQAFLNGGLGGPPDAGLLGTAGGFGGGAGVGHRASGGGGWSGGGGDGNTSGGGGGGSYNGGINQSNASGVRSGHGLVVITQLCDISIYATNTLICTGTTVTLTTNAVSGYTWTPASNASSLVVSPTITTTYSLAATSSLSCIANTVITIVVNNNPTVTASVSSPSVCSGKTVTFTATGANTYTWTNGVTNATSFTATASGMYSVTGENACGTSANSVSLTVLALPSISATASTPSVCSGNTVVISGSGGTGYSITPNVGINTTFTPLVTNTYIVTGSGANTCTNTAVVVVTVVNTPTVAPVVTPTAICVGQTATIAAALGATGYTWTAPNFGGSNNPTVQVSPASTTTYVLNRANGTCTSVAQLTLVVNTLPVLSISPPTTVCACTGGATLITVGAITYTWLNSGAQGGQLTVFPCNTTNYTVAASNNFCTTYSTVLVTTSPNPTINISSTASVVCSGSTVGLTATGAPNFTWTSNPPGFNSNNPIIQDTPPLGGRQFIATGSSTANCVTSAVYLVQVNPNPTLTVVSNNTLLCNGASATLTASNAAPTPPVTYSWSNNNATTPAIAVSPTVSTNYTVTGTYGTGCKTTTVYPLTVYIATFAVNTPSAVCSGVSNTLIATSSAALSYTWGTSPIQTGSTAVVSPTTTTSYTVKGANGPCQVTNTVNVPVNPLPNVQIVAPKWVICLFEEVQLTASGALTYTWNGTDVQPSISFSATGNGGPNGAPTISTTFTLTGIDVNGCVKTTTATVFVSNCTGIDEQSASSAALEVYPNPNAGNFTIKTDKAMELVIVNELGQNVQYIHMTDMMSEVNVSGLANGIYYIMGENQGRIIAKKLVINK